MNVYLIQTSGADVASNASPTYVSATKGRRFFDEPLHHQQYFNAEPYWKQGFQRRYAWQTASPGDVVLLYCTGSVDRYASSLSHVFSIGDKRIVDTEGAWLEFDRQIELASPIAYSTIKTQIERGNFSDGMKRCGQEGFNIRQVKESDLETVQRLSPPVSGEWDAVL